MLSDEQRETLRKARMIAYEDGTGGWLFRPATDAEMETAVERIVAEQVTDARYPLLREIARLQAAERALVERIEALHVRRDQEVRDYECWEGDCDHAPDDYAGDFPSPQCPILAEAVCAHCADQTAPEEPWEHMIRSTAFWPCATVAAVRPDTEGAEG